MRSLRPDPSSPALSRPNGHARVLAASAAVVALCMAAADPAGASGAYSLPHLEPGSYSVKAKKKGCRALTKPVTVTANATATLNFALTCT